jgi:hypothetical protein
MRVASVSSHKGVRSGHSKTRNRPAPESQAGRLLGLLMAGDWVSAQAVLGTKNRGYVIEYLRSMYGMEIESGRKGCRLLGEWDGMYFVPVERMQLELDDKPTA